MTNLMRLMEAAGGAQRRIVGITWRHFYAVPVVRDLASWFSGAPEALDARGFAELVRAGEATDVAVMPEGDNCNFGDGSEVQPFLSPRFVEIAARAEAGILVAAHSGSEAWAREVAVGSWGERWFGWLPDRSRSRLAEIGRINVPALPRPVERMRYRFEVVEPSVDASDLPVDAPAPRELLEDDARRVYTILRDSVASMRAEA